MHALAQLIERRLDVLLSAGGWFETSAYAAWHVHPAFLADEVRADEILALCAPQAHAARRRYVSQRRRQEELERAVRALLSA